jgi:hypothetical protein
MWLSDPKGRGLYDNVSSSGLNEPLLNIKGAHPELPDRHTFVILACDGVWDVLSNEDAVRFIAEDDGDPETVSSRLLQASVSLSMPITPQTTQHCDAYYVAARLAQGGRSQWSGYQPIDGCATWKAEERASRRLNGCVSVKQQRIFSNARSQLTNCSDCVVPR